MDLASGCDHLGMRKCCPRRLKDDMMFDFEHMDSLSQSAKPFVGY